MPRRARARDDLADIEVRRRPGTTAASALHIRHAMASPVTARPEQLLHLQRAAGNTAMQHLVAQRKRPLNWEEAGLTAHGVQAGVLGQGGGIEQVLDFRNADYKPSTSATGAGAAGVAVGAVGTTAGIALGSRNIHKLRKRLANATDPLERKAIIRELKTAGVDVGEKVAGVGGHVADATALAMSASAAAGAAAGGVAAPLQAFSVGREMRKFFKQKRRLEKLHQVAASWDDPPAALAAKVQLVDEAKATADAALEALIAFDRTVFKSGGDLDKAKKTPEYLDLHKAYVDAQKAHTDAQAEVALIQAERQKMQDAVAKEGATGEPSLRTIQMYAARKSKRGLWKKMTTIVGGTLGVAGSIGLAVAAGAGAAALMATPIGWALAAGAAAAAIGLGIYKLVKWIKKRNHPNKRKIYAEHLFKLGLLRDEQGKEARKLILSLVNKANLKLEGATDPQAKLLDRLTDADKVPLARKQFIQMLEAKLAS